MLNMSHNKGSLLAIMSTPRGPPIQAYTNFMQNCMDLSGGCTQCDPCNLEPLYYSCTEYLPLLSCSFSAGAMMHKDAAVVHEDFHKYRQSKPPTPCPWYRK